MYLSHTHFSNSPNIQAKCHEGAKYIVLYRKMELLQLFWRLNSRLKTTWPKQSFSSDIKDFLIEVWEKIPYEFGKKIILPRWASPPSRGSSPHIKSLWLSLLICLDNVLSILKNIEKATRSCHDPTPKSSDSFFLF